MENKEKTKFQEAAKLLGNKHDFLAIEAITGSGKGLAVMKCIESDESGLKWLVLVPETLQIINLQDDIIKHSMEHLYDKIEDIICYASIHKYQGRELNVWANEAHRLSECRTDISKTIKYKRIIADSATLSKDIKDRLAQLGNFHYFKLGLKSAIEKGIVAEPVIYTIGIDVDNKIKRNPTKFGDKVISLTDREYIEKIEKEFIYWKTRLVKNPKEKWILGRFNNMGTERKKFFAKCKMEALKSLLKTLENKRWVCFAGTTGQADELNLEHSVHSKRGKKHNVLTLERFNRKEISSIIFHKMGSEGLNLKDIDCVIIPQLSTGKDENLSTIQKGGRAFRSENPEIYILYCKNTKDEEWFKEAIKIYNPSWVKPFIV